MESNSAPGSPEDGTVFEPGATEPNVTSLSPEEGTVFEPGATEPNVTSLSPEEDTLFEPGACISATSRGCYPLKQPRPEEFKLLRQGSLEEKTSSDVMLGKQTSDTDVNPVVHDAERSRCSSKGSRNTTSSKSRKKPKKKPIITENDFMMSRLKKLVTQQHKITFPKVKKSAKSDRKMSENSVQIEVSFD